MNRKRFNHIIDHRVEKSISVFKSKNDEYASEEEVFQNFKDGVGISYNNTPEKYAWELLSKHLQSIKDILNNIENDNYPSLSLIDEKMNDSHNYLYLIEGMITEKIEKIKTNDDRKKSSST